VRKISLSFSDDLVPKLIGNHFFQGQNDKKRFISQNFRACGALLTSYGFVQLQNLVYNPVQQ
jgi:hypothetical protein